MYRLWRIAVRDLRRNKRRSALTLIAVMMGLALVITLHSFEMGAMQGAIENNIRVQTGHVQVRAGSYDEEKVSLKWEDLLQEPQVSAAQAQGLPNVRAAAPVLWASGILVTAEESVGSMGLRLGDSVSLLINTSDEEPDEAIFEIRGLYDTGLPGFDNATIFLPLAKAQAFTRVGDRASAVVVLLNDQEDADTVAEPLRAPGLEVVTWRDLNQLMLQAVESSMGILYLMYLIVLAIVAVVVANTLLMSVFERTREMGILASLGMKGRQIMAMFLMESATLGVIGIILGVALGSLGVYYLATEGFHYGELASVGGTEMALGTTMYAAFQWADTATLAIACLIIILLASLYPAWFATRKEPIDALRAF
jgi:ABC-type lipoprotein release transport system permease subunit